MTLEDEIRNAIANALFESRRMGMPDEAAAAAAMLGVMMLVRPYIEALERVCPAEAQALDLRRGEAWKGGAGQH